MNHHLGWITALVIIFLFACSFELCGSLLCSPIFPIQCPTPPTCGYYFLRGPHQTLMAPVPKLINGWWVKVELFFNLIKFQVKSVKTGSVFWAACASLSYFYMVGQFLIFSFYSIIPSLSSPGSVRRKIFTYCTITIISRGISWTGVQVNPIF